MQRVGLGVFGGMGLVNLVANTGTTVLALNYQAMVLQHGCVSN